MPLCLVYVVSWRATWATLPWSIVLGCWVTLIQSLNGLKVASTLPVDSDLLGLLQSLVIKTEKEEMKRTVPSSSDMR